MCGMNKVAQVLAALEALTLFAVGVMEAFFFRSPELHAIFLIEPGEYDAVRLWTVNVGFYNIFMAIGLIVALVFVNTGRVVEGRTIVLHHHHARGAARGGLETERAAAGEEVEAGAVVQALAEPVEEGFAHAVGGGPQLRGRGKLHDAAAPLAGDDADAIAAAGSAEGHRRKIIT